jgi:hypothetical protein
MPDETGGDHGVRPDNVVPRSEVGDQDSYVVTLGGFGDAHDGCFE